MTPAPAAVATAAALSSRSQSAATAPAQDSVAASSAAASERTVVNLKEHRMRRLFAEVLAGFDRAMDDVFAAREVAGAERPERGQRL